MAPRTVTRLTVNQVARFVAALARRGAQPLKPDECVRVSDGAEVCRYAHRGQDVYVRRRTNQRKYEELQRRYGRPEWRIVTGDGAWCGAQARDAQIFTTAQQATRKMDDLVDRGRPFVVRYTPAAYRRRLAR